MIADIPSHLFKENDFVRTFYVGASLQAGSERLHAIFDFVASEGFRRQELEDEYRRSPQGESELDRRVMQPLNLAWYNFRGITDTLKEMDPKSRHALSGQVVDVATNLIRSYDTATVAYTRDNPNGWNPLAEQLPRTRDGFVNPMERTSYAAYRRLERMIELVSQ